MTKRPYTKVMGYRASEYDALNGWFVVQSTYAPGLGFGPKGYLPWAVTSVDRKQTIYTKTLVEAKRVAVTSADGCHLDEWDYEFSRAGERGTPAYQDWLN